MLLEIGRIGIADIRHETKLLEMEDKKIQEIHIFNIRQKLFEFRRTDKDQIFSVRKKLEYMTKIFICDPP